MLGSFVCVHHHHVQVFPLNAVNRIAGTDTTSTTLSYLLWELSRRPDIMARLQAELDECMPDTQSIPGIQELQKLPYLTALIKEGLSNTMVILS